MNNIVNNFDQILNFAKEYNLPVTKKRAILREYLQGKILEYIYKEKVSKHIYFVGGTSLRLLRNLDRFSENLDFDVLKISHDKLELLIQNLHKSLKQENFVIDLYKNKTQRRNYYELRFRDLLFDLKITDNQSEKLMIKLDFEYFWQDLTNEVVMFSRYGSLANIVTLPLNQILVQKFHAYLNRKQTVPRDIYDIVWLLSQNSTPDIAFMKKNNLNKKIIADAVKKFKSEEKKLKVFQRQLAPFLINETNIHKLEFFPRLVENLIP